MSGDLTKHFSHYELECHCGCKRIDMDPDFLERLEALRVLYGFAMVPSSGFRCPEHNAMVSKTGLGGPHTTGKAVDILCSGSNFRRLLELVVYFDFPGLGFHQRGEHSKRFIHLDDLEEGRGWTY